MIVAIEQGLPAALKVAGGHAPVQYFVAAALNQPVAGRVRMWNLVSGEGVKIGRGQRIDFVAVGVALLAGKALQLKVRHTAGLISTALRFSVSASQAA